MIYDPYKIIPAIIVVAIKDNQILLGQRKNSGYMDGWWGPPGGHLEEDERLEEGAARELKEETGLIVKPQELELFHVYQDKNTPGRQYLGFIFRAKSWSGDLATKDDKVADIKFFEINNLPEKLIPFYRNVFKHIKDHAIDITFNPLGSFDPSGE